MEPLLQQALKAHGGLAHWRDIGQIRVAASMIGEIFDRRRQIGALDNTMIAIDPHRPKVIFENRKNESRKGVFDVERPLRR